MHLHALLRLFALLPLTLLVTLAGCGSGDGDSDAGPKPRLGLETTIIEISGNIGEDVSGSFAVHNLGDAPLEFSARTEALMLRLKGTDGRLDPRQTARIVVDVTCPETPARLAATLELHTNVAARPRVNLLVRVHCIDPAAPTGEVGNLDLEVLGLPDGLDASIILEAPGGTISELTGTTLLEALPVGVYMFTATEVRQGGRTYSPAPRVSSIAVEPNDTVYVTFTYEETEALATLRIEARGLPEPLQPSYLIENDAGPVTGQTGHDVELLLPEGRYTIVPDAVRDAHGTYVAAVEVVELGPGEEFTLTVDYEALTGSLDVEIEGLPAGVDAAITLVAPNSTETPIAASGRIEDLAPGRYMLSVHSVTDGEALYLPSDDLLELDVYSGAAAQASVVYTRVAGELNLVVTGLPDALDAAIVLHAPDGTPHPVTATTLFDTLEPGTYTLTAEPVERDGAHYLPTPAELELLVASGEPLEVEVVYALQPGTLVIGVSGLPAGVAADIEITGPDGFATTLTGPRLLDDLHPGTYTVTARPVEVPASDEPEDPENPEEPSEPLRYEPQTATHTVTLISGEPVIYEVTYTLE